MRITEDIYRVDGVRGANAYLIVAPSGLAIVDTGMPGNGRRIVGFLGTLGFEPSDLRRILLTHSDIDHVGSVAELKTLTNASVAIHSDDAPVLAGHATQSKGHGLLQIVFKLLAPFVNTKPVEPDTLLEDGDTVAGFHVLHVPGHTLGSIALWREDGVAFVGDALRSDAHGNVLPPAPAVTLDLAQAMASANEIESRHFTTILTGHGAPALAGSAD